MLQSLFSVSEFGPDFLLELLEIVFSVNVGLMFLDLFNSFRR